MKDRLETARNAYPRGVQQNNGVKDKDVLRLLLPVGIQHYQFDRTWLATIDWLGSARVVLCRLFALVLVIAQRLLEGTRDHRPSPRAVDPAAAGTATAHQAPRDQPRHEALKSSANEALTC